MLQDSCHSPWRASFHRRSTIGEFCSWTMAAPTTLLKRLLRFGIASVPKSDTSSKRIVVCQRQETLPFGPNSRIPRSARCRRCVVALPTLRVVENLVERPQVGLVYGLITDIDQENRRGITWLGNLSDADGHIAPQIYMRKVEMPCPTITFRRNTWMRLAFSTRRCALQKIEISGFASPCDTKLGLSPRFSPTTGYRRTLCPPTDSGCFRRNSSSFENITARRVVACDPRQIALARSYKQRAEALKVQSQPWAAPDERPCKL